eukprot:Tamp_06505.p1 GENE.Tamp_06505~~Tamp_06505.p1  ORF type:complete len:871 (-),score=69.12 Tamp_06505:85-2571(-)
MPRAAPRKVPLRRPLPQRKRCGGGHQPVYLLDQPQWPALAELEAADDQHGRSAFRARASEDGVVFDPHAVTAGLPVRTLNPRPTTPQPLAALAALGFCASAAPKGSVFSHIGGTRAAGRAETVTQEKLRNATRTEYALNRDRLIAERVSKARAYDKGHGAVPLNEAMRVDAPLSKHSPTRPGTSHGQTARERPATASPNASPAALRVTISQIAVEQMSQSTHSSRPRGMLLPFGELHDREGPAEKVDLRVRPKTPNRLQYRAHTPMSEQKPSKVDFGRPKSAMSTLSEAVGPWKEETGHDGVMLGSNLSSSVAYSFLRFEGGASATTIETPSRRKDAKKAMGAARGKQQSPTRTKGSRGASAPISPVRGRPQELAPREGSAEFSRNNCQGSLPSDDPLSADEVSSVHHQHSTESSVSFREFSRDTLPDDEMLDSFHSFHPPRVSVSVNSPAQVKSPVGGRPRSHRVTSSLGHAGEADTVAEVLQVGHLKGSKLSVSAQRASIGTVQGQAGSQDRGASTEEDTDEDYTKDSNVAVTSGAHKQTQPSSSSLAHSLRQACNPPSRDGPDAKLGDDESSGKVAAEASVPDTAVLQRHVESAGRRFGLHQDPFFKVNFEFDTSEHSIVHVGGFRGGYGRSQRRPESANHITNFQKFQYTMKQDLAHAKTNRQTRTQILQREAGKAYQSPTSYSERFARAQRETPQTARQLSMEFASVQESGDGRLPDAVPLYIQGLTGPGDRAIIPPASGLGCNVSQETEEDRHLGVTLDVSAREQSIEGERSKESVRGSIREGSREWGRGIQIGEKREKHGGEAVTERIPGYVSSPFMRPSV